MSSFGEPGLEVHDLFEQPGRHVGEATRVVAQPREQPLVAVELVVSSCLGHAVGEHHQAVACSQPEGLVPEGHVRERADQ